MVRLPRLSPRVDQVGQQPVSYRGPLILRGLPPQDIVVLE